MGAPKQKWTQEEEAALIAGIAKYGSGKWSSILKDPEFSVSLILRSNVDLKDKWRNINVANGNGSRQKSKTVSRINQKLKEEDESKAIVSRNNQKLKEADESKAIVIVNPPVDNVYVDAVPLTICPALPLPPDNCLKQIPSLDDCILEIIKKLNEPRGSSRVAIAEHIKEQFASLPNLDKRMEASLKLLVGTGKLIKVKHLYRIAPPATLFHSRGAASSSLQQQVEAQKPPTPKIDMNQMKILSRLQVDTDLENMRSMTAQQAAAAAAQAVAEAEVAIAAAEAAAREAEKAEADAEAAQVFSEAALKALKCKTLCF